MRNLSLFILAAVCVSCVFTACGRKTIEEGKPKPNTSLEVDPSELTFKAEGEALTVDVTSELPWNATTNNDWLTIVEGESAFTVTAAANESADPRIGSITVDNGTESEVKTIAVMQLPLPEPDCKEIIAGVNDVKGRYLGGDDASEFFLRIGTFEGPGLILEGFTTKAKYADFKIEPGVYTVADDAGAPFTLRPGWILPSGGYNLVYGTFSWEEENKQHVERPSVEGTVTVGYSDGVYTITSELTGYDRDDTDNVKSKIRYRYTGPLPVFSNEAGDDGDIFGRSTGYYMSNVWCDIFQLKLWRADDIDYNEGVYIEGYCDSGTFDTYGYLPSSFYEVEDAMYSAGTLKPGGFEGSEPAGTFFFREMPAAGGIPISSVRFATRGNIQIEYDPDELLYTIDMVFSGADKDGQAFTNEKRQFKGPISFTKVN